MSEKILRMQIAKLRHTLNPEGNVHESLQAFSDLIELFIDYQYDTFLCHNGFDKKNLKILKKQKGKNKNES